MEAPVSLHPHQACSVQAHACRLLFLPAKSRELLEPCVCQSASACNVIHFFPFEKRKPSVARRGIGRVTQKTLQPQDTHARKRTHARAHTHTPHMAKQARKVALAYDLPHLLQGEQRRPLSCAKASQEEVAEDLYSVRVRVRVRVRVCVCVCRYLFTNFSLSSTVSRLFIILHKNKIQV
jgi:hypothetical protein